MFSQPHFKKELPNVSEVRKVLPCVLCLIATLPISPHIRLYLSLMDFLPILLPERLKFLLSKLVYSIKNNAKNSDTMQAVCHNSKETSG